MAVAKPTLTMTATTAKVRVGVPDYYKTIKAKEIVISLWVLCGRFLTQILLFILSGCAVSVIIRLGASVVCWSVKLFPFLA